MPTNISDNIDRDIEMRRGLLHQPLYYVHEHHVSVCVLKNSRQTTTINPVGTDTHA